MMLHTILTLKSNEIPDLPNLEAIDNQKLLKKIINQLELNKYILVSQKKGHIRPIEGYKTPLDRSEIVIHICLRDDSNFSAIDDSINEKLIDYININNLIIVEAVRHVDGKYTKIIVNIDEKI